MSDANDRGRRILYLSYNGVGTPLVRSQVLPYLREMRDEFAFDLLTFEGATADPPPPADEVDQIEVHRLRYHKRPNIPAKILDLLTGALTAGAVVRARRPVLIHARSHLPALIAAIVGRVSGTPVLFDMRGFLADEYIEAGTWRRGGWKERTARFAELLLLRLSGAIVVLTERARNRIASEPQFRKAADGKAVVVIPCCVDVHRFRPGSPPVAESTLVYSGSLGTWYLLEEMLGFFEALVRLRPAAEFLILNRGEHAVVENALRSRPSLVDRVRIVAVDYADVPRRLAGCGAGIILLREGASKPGSSPIKLSEYLACGLPVVVNEAVGDAPELLRGARAGVVLTSLDASGLAAGASALDALLAEGAPARSRARALAEAAFSLELGVARYRDVYRALERGSPSASATR